MILVFAAVVWCILVIGSVLFVGRRQPSIPSLAGRLRFIFSHDLVRDLMVVGGIGIGTALFFWRLLAGQVHIPAGGGDLAQFLFPTYSFAAEWWRRGFVPLWNPYLFAGAPFVGDIQSGIFYPINLLTFLISVPLTFRDLELLSVLHFFIAGIGMYFLLQYGKFGIHSRAASLLGAVAFEFSDLFITHFGNLNLIAVAAWMPLVLLTYRRAVQDRRSVFAVLAGILLTVSFLAGHIQSFLFVLVGLALFAVYEAVTFDARRALGMFVLTGVIALGLCSPVLLPSVEMMQLTLRSAYSYEQAARFSLPPAELIGLVVPGFFGRGPMNYWGPWDRVEVGYIGILPLFLALLALALRRESFVRFSGGVALVGLALALGGYAILHGWLYQFVPGFGQLRAPARAIFLFDFGLATLAALGLDSLLKRMTPEIESIFRRIVYKLFWVLLLIALASGVMGYSILILGQSQDPVIFARMANAVNSLAFALLLGGLAFTLIAARLSRLFGPVWTLLAVALVFFDLFSLGAYVDASTDDPSRVFDHPDAVSFLKSSPGIFRVDARETGVDSAWPADTAILYGLYDVNGENPLVLADYERYWQSLGSRSTALYDLLGVKYLIARKSVPVDRTKFNLAFDVDPAFNIYENSRALPHAFIVGESKNVPDRNAALAALHSEDFDPTRVVILENGPEVRSKTIDSAKASITGYAPNEIRLATDSPDKGFLVLSEVYYPGWKAWVGDREVSVLRANFTFRAIEVDPGVRSVRLAYDPASFRVGVALFSSTLVCLAAWLIMAFYHKRASARQPIQDLQLTSQGNR